MVPDRRGHPDLVVGRLLIDDVCPQAAQLQRQHALLRAAQARLSAHLSELAKHEEPCLLLLDAEVGHKGQANLFWTFINNVSTTTFASMIQKCLVHVNLTTCVSGEVYMYYMLKRSNFYMGPGGAVPHTPGLSQQCRWHPIRRQSGQ